MRSFANDRLGGRMTIRGEVTFHDTLPRNKMGKLMRAQFKKSIEG